MWNDSGRGLRYLFDAERVLQTARPHPVVLARPFGRWLIAILGAWAAGSAAVALRFWPTVSIAVAWAAALVTAHAAVSVLRWWASQFVITDQRVLIVSGVLSAKVSSFPLSKVTEAAIDSGVIGRLLGYGDILLRLSGGKTAVCRLERFPRPKQAYRLLNGLMARANQPGVAVPAAVFTDPGLEDTGRLPRVIL